MSGETPSKVPTPCSLSRSTSGETTNKVPAAHSGRVHVFCRVRPLLVTEEGSCVAVDEDNGDLEIFEHDRTVDSLLSGSLADSTAAENRKFHFDGVFGGTVEQKDVFQAVGLASCRDVLRGINGCILAYGQTGAGKTHSLLASGGAGDAGILPRVAASLFVLIGNDSQHVYDVEAAAIQIYNEQLEDLFQSLEKGPNLTIGAGGEVSNLTWERCSKPDSMLELIHRARSKIVYAETKINKLSSRAHAVFQIRVTRRQRAAEGDGDGAKMMKTTFGTLSVVDLAGSERVKRSGVVGKEFKEATNINGSLLALGNVVSALAARQRHVPFRDSKLTHVLSGSIGGNCKTSLLVCVSPTVDSASETIHALEFASRAMSVISEAKVNEGLVEVPACQLAKDLIAEDLDGVLSDAQKLALQLEQQLEQNQRESREAMAKAMEECQQQASLASKHASDLQQLRLEMKMALEKETSVQQELAKVTEDADKEMTRIRKHVNELKARQVTLTEELEASKDTSKQLETILEKERQENRQTLESMRKDREQYDESLCERKKEMQQLQTEVGEAAEKENALRQELEGVTKQAAEDKANGEKLVKTLEDGNSKLAKELEEVNCSLTKLEQRNVEEQQENKEAIAKSRDAIAKARQECEQQASLAAKHQKDAEDLRLKVETISENQTLVQQELSKMSNDAAKEIQQLKEDKLELAKQLEELQGNATQLEMKLATEQQDSSRQLEDSAKQFEESKMYAKQLEEKLLNVQQELEEQGKLAAGHANDTNSLRAELKAASEKQVIVEQELSKTKEESTEGMAQLKATMERNAALQKEGEWLHSEVQASAGRETALQQKLDETKKELAEVTEDAAKKYVHAKEELAEAAAKLDNVTKQNIEVTKVLKEAAKNQTQATENADLLKEATATVDEISVELFETAKDAAKNQTRVAENIKELEESKAKLLEEMLEAKERSEYLEQRLLKEEQESKGAIVKVKGECEEQVRLVQQELAKVRQDMTRRCEDLRGQAKDLEEKKTKLEKELQEAKTLCAELEQKLESSERKSKTALAKATEECGRQNSELQRLREQLKVAMEKKAELNQSLGKVDSELKQVREELNAAQEKKAQLKVVLAKVNKKAAEDRNSYTELSKKMEDENVKLSRDLNESKGIFNNMEHKYVKEQHKTKELEKNNSELKKDLEKVKVALKECQQKLQQKQNASPSINEVIALYKAEEEKNKENPHQRIKMLEKLKQEVNELREQNAQLRASGASCTCGASSDRPSVGSSVPSVCSPQSTRKRRLSAPEKRSNKDMSPGTPSQKQRASCPLTSIEPSSPRLDFAPPERTKAWLRSL